MDPASSKRHFSLKVWFMQRRPWQRWIVYLCCAFLVLAVLHRLIELITPEVKDPNYGASFSVKYAKELGLDWRETYTALLDDMGIRRFRLMSYWDITESKRGVFTFQDLDWQMDEAHKRGAKISLAVGLRQPRWPECHPPDWYNSLSDQEKEKALITFIEAVVRRYRDHPALVSYQLENEAVNRHFGKCPPETIDQKRLAREFSAIKRLDVSKPVVMSLSDQHGLPLGIPIPDIYGFSVYRTVWNDKLSPLEFYMTYPTPIWYHRIRAEVINILHNKGFFIHELQLEPWGPKATKDLSIEDQNKSMSTDQIHKSISFARKIGVQDIDLWGSEWWYWRKTTHNDSSVWDTIKSELSRD